MLFRVILLITLVTSMSSLAFGEVSFCNGTWTNKPCSNANAKPLTAKINKTKRSNDVGRISINPMIELDFKSKEEILDIRRQAVAEHFDLVSKHYSEAAKANTSWWKKTIKRFFSDSNETPQTYSPSSAVFGQIESGKPWWGILGISYFGPGKQGIDGPSEETRLLANPYLLVGLIESSAHVIADSRLSPQAIYPKPLSLNWKPEENTATATYDVSYYIQAGRKYHYSKQSLSVFTLAAYNARDLRYNYLFVEPSQSSNVRSHNQSNQAVKIRQYIHRGGSCGYPGGCNNMSPHQEELELDILSLPGKVHVKLWKEQPKSGAIPADFDFVLALK